MSDFENTCQKLIDIRYVKPLNHVTKIYKDDICIIKMSTKYHAHCVSSLIIRYDENGKIINRKKDLIYYYTSVSMCSAVLDKMLDKHTNKNRTRYMCSKTFELTEKIRYW